MVGNTVSLPQETTSSENTKLYSMEYVYIPGHLYSIRLKESYKTVHHLPHFMPATLKPAYKTELWRLPGWYYHLVREYTEWISTVIPVTRLNGCLKVVS